MSGTIQIKVNGTIPGHPPGSIVKVAVDAEGTPLELLWRRRLKDAKIDKCCEIVPGSKGPEPKIHEEPKPGKSGGETESRRSRRQRSE